MFLSELYSTHIQPLRLAFNLVVAADALINKPSSWGTAVMQMDVAWEQGTLYKSYWEERHG